MEHIIQLGVSIDDDKIEKALIKSATEKLQQELREEIFSRSGWDKGFSPTAERIINKTLTDWKDEIISRAAEIVADSIKRSKAYREKVKEITDAV